jgi:succinate dehydrogenase/fumarate reductase-like Fe-S protein
LGFKKAFVGDSPVPAWFKEPSFLETALDLEEIPLNTTGYLVNKEKKDWPVLLLVDSHGIRSLNVLFQENQLLPENIFAAVLHQGKIELVEGKDTVSWVQQHWDEFPDEKPQDFSDVDALSERERFDFFKEEFSRCIKCYACRESCPMCYCQQCIVEKNQPQWIPVSSHELGNWHWNIVRAFHLASRCVGCGNCVNSCPQGLRLDLLNYAMAKTVQEQFDYEAGKAAEGPNALQYFKEDDKENFFR